MYDSIILRWKKANPSQCHVLGIHDYDGQMPNLSKDGVNHRIQVIQTDLKDLLKIEAPNNVFDKYEYNLIKTILEVELYNLNVHQEFLKSPVPYVFGWNNGRS